MLRSLLRSLYPSLFRLQVRLCCYFLDHFQRFNRTEVSIPPALLRFRVSESLSVAKFTRIGRRCAEIINERIAACGIELNRGTRILDFGCGCGRTISWLILKHSEVDFYGTDVDSQAVNWCRKHFRGANFGVNGPLPPLAYPDQYFTVVYCLSVFTHLMRLCKMSGWLNCTEPLNQEKFS